MKITLNLLPPGKKDELRKAFIFTYAQSMIFLILLVVGFVSFTLLSVRLLMYRNLTDLSHRTAPETDEFRRVTDDIRLMNNYMERLDRLSDNPVSWSALYDGLDQLVPPGVVLNRLTVTRDGHVIVAGIGQTRDDVLTLSNNLEASPHFRNIKSPLANILQRTDVHFELEATYVPFTASPRVNLTGASSAPPKK